MSKKPSERFFPYYYKNGELHAFKLGGHGKDQAAFLDCLDEEVRFLKESRRRINTWIDLYETELPHSIAEVLVDKVSAVAGQISLLALVGKINLHKRRRLRRLFSLKAEFCNTIVRFFADPEDAKTWLVKGEAWLGNKMLSSGRKPY